MRSATAFVAGLLMLTTTAEAASVVYRADFTFGSGPLAGQLGRATFVVDSSLLEADADYFEPLGLNIDSIRLNIGGNIFRRTNADALFLLIEGGEVVDFILGGTPSGLDLIDSSDPAADFLLDLNTLGYKLPGTGELIFSGDLVAFARVPEALPFALLGLGWMALTGCRIRRT